MKDKFPFLVAKEELIKEGKTTDIYFVRTKKILEKRGIKKRVWAEFTVSSPPYPYFAFAGIREVLELLEGKKVNLWALREGEIVPSSDINGVLIPVMAIEGKYVEFCEYETPILGFICHASGILSKAIRIRKAAKENIVLSFGIRRMHPALAPFIDFYAYMGGCDGVSSLVGAEVIGESPRGTMPHSLIILMGEKEAWKAFDEDMPPDVPRIALIDTYGDEKVQAIKACEAISDLAGVRLDTPSSRRGDMARIIREIKWELKIRGKERVKVFISGGLDEYEIKKLVEVGADGFGVGTSLSNAIVIDYAMDITEVEGKPCAKKGKFGGKKKPFICERDRTIIVEEFNKDSVLCPKCGKEMNSAFIKYMEDGNIVYEFENVSEVRKRIIEKLKNFTLEDFNI
ncbi:MAG: nicotinate phosphoribosyltransferase [Candidatus Hydrothermales bacterium]